MGRAPRYVPKYLGTKLAKIRERLGVKTYEEMIARLNVPEVKLYRANILRYESGKLEPPSIVLLSYARLARVTIEELVDDELEITVK
jgi:transcriptional regulator with XRE-family HTH domain